MPAQAPTETPGCDCHENIPKDANGDPIFLILPPDMRAKYEERLSGFERAWDATKDPAYWRQALAWIRNHRQVPPPWFYEAGDRIATGKRTADHDEQYRDAQRHRLRYEVVRDLIAAGWKEEAAFDQACEHLKKIGAAAARRTIEDSYRKVLREYKAGRHGRYKPLVHGRFRTINGRPVE